MPSELESRWAFASPAMTGRHDDETRLNKPSSHAHISAENYNCQCEVISLPWLYPAREGVRRRLDSRAHAGAMHLSIYSGARIMFIVRTIAIVIVSTPKKPQPSITTLTMLGTGTSTRYSVFRAGADALWPVLHDSSRVR